MITSRQWAEQRAEGHGKPGALYETTTAKTLESKIWWIHLI